MWESNNSKYRVLLSAFYCTLNRLCRGVSIVDCCSDALSKPCSWATDAACPHGWRTIIELLKHFEWKGEKEKKHYLSLWWFEWMLKMSASKREKCEADIFSTFFYFNTTVFLAWSVMNMQYLFKNKVNWLVLQISKDHKHLPQSEILASGSLKL